MAPISIQLKIISAKDLKSFNFFQKLTIYTTVSLITEQQDKQKQIHQHNKTPVDREGDANPEWNHLVQFDLKDIITSNLDHIFLEFHLMCEGIIFGDKTIGEVRVPFTDLIGDSNGVVRFICYQVKSPDGNPNGVLDFSYKVVDDNVRKEHSFYPVIDNFTFHVPNNFYPPTEVCCEADSVVYPPRPLPIPPHHMMPGDVYYPPPPPPPPMAYHPPQPPPYGFGYGGYCYQSMCTYPTVEHLQHQCDEDTWQRDGGFSASWNVS